MISETEIGLIQVKYLQAKTRFGSQQYIEGDDTVGKSVELYGEWASTEISLMLDFISLGDTVVDVGCNIGIHTMEFAEKVGEAGFVFAFDPQIEVLACAISTAMFQNRKNIIFSGFGLSDSFKSLWLTHEKNLELNFGARKISREQNSNYNSPASVKLAPLDALVLVKPTLIKVDIEGHELNFLAGARKTISRYKPTMFLEANTPEAIKSIKSWSRRHGYSSIVLSIKAFNPGNFAKNAIDVFGPSTETMIVLLPKRSEKLSRFEALLNEPRYQEKVKIEI